MENVAKLQCRLMHIDLFSCLNSSYLSYFKSETYTIIYVVLACTCKSSTVVLFVLKRVGEELVWNSFCGNNWWVLKL